MDKIMSFQSDKIMSFQSDKIIKCVLIGGMSFQSDKIISDKIIRRHVFPK
jgi:hypothetical protein